MPQLTANTEIQINVPIGGPNGKVSSGYVLRQMKASVLGLPTNVGNAPVFPNDEISAVHADQALSAAQRKARVDAIINNYKKLQENFINLGGVNQIELVPNAVVNYLVQHEGFASEPSDQAPYISASDLSATFVGDETVVVTGNAVWG